MAKIKRKISLKDVPVDVEHTEDQGFVNLKIQWIVTDEVGAKDGCLNHVEFLSSSSHEFHTHPNVEEIFFVLSGHGLAVSGDETFEIDPGDTVFVPKGEKHYFRNLLEKEPLVALSAYFGAPNIDKAGYVRLGEKGDS